MQGERESRIVASSALVDHGDFPIVTTRTSSPKIAKKENKASQQATNSTRRTQKDKQTRLMVPRGRSLAIDLPGIWPLELEFTLHEVQRLWEVGLDAESLEVVGRLLNALDFALHVPVLAIAEPPAHDIDHSRVQARVKVTASFNVGWLAAVKAAVRVEVAAKLEEQVKCVTGTARQLG